MDRQAAEQKPLLPGKPGFIFGVLGSFEFRTAGNRFQAQWKDALQRVAAERPFYAACLDGTGDCPPKLKEWRRFLAEFKELPQREQMIRLNRAVNGLVKYEDDRNAFGQRDYWATPLQALERGGDCEDYAILKFVSLLELGFDNSQLRFTIVKDRRRGLMHAVVAVNLDGETYILDNLNDYAVEQQYVLKYVPLYSADLESQWVHVVTPKIRAGFITQVLKHKPVVAAQEQLNELPHVAQNAGARNAALPAADGDASQPATGSCSSQLNRRCRNCAAQCATTFR